MLPDALAIIVVQKLGPERLAHRAGGAHVLLEQFFEPIGGLRVAVAEAGAFGRGGKDVRRAELVAIDRDFFLRLRPVAEATTQNERRPTQRSFDKRTRRQIMATASCDTRTCRTER